jgi:hypothetical protein
MLRGRNLRVSHDALRPLRSVARQRVGTTKNITSYASGTVLAAQPGCSKITAVQRQQGCGHSPSRPLVLEITAK